MASLCGGPMTAKSRYPPRVSEGAMAGGTLRIVVCIKQVPKAQELQVDPKTQTLKRVGVPSEINPPDRNALEFALQAKDAHGAEVVVLSMGPTAFDESLERAGAGGGGGGGARPPALAPGPRSPRAPGTRCRPRTR